MKIISRIPTTLALLLAAACSSSTTPEENPFDNFGHLQLVNALATTGGTTLKLDADEMPLPTEGTAIGFPIEPGAHRLEVRSANGTLLASRDFSVSEGRHHVAMVGKQGSGVNLLFGSEPTDTASAPPISGAKIRVVHLADGEPDYWAYVYQIGNPVDSAARFLTPFRYGIGTDAQFPGYAVRPSGSYRVRATLPGSTAAVVESDVITMSDAQVWSVVLSRKADGSLQFVAVRDNNERTQ